jgi:hypothetical protein
MTRFSIAKNFKIDDYQSWFCWIKRGIGFSNNVHVGFDKVGTQINIWTHKT